MRFQKMPVKSRLGLVVLVFVVAIILISTFGIWSLKDSLNNRLFPRRLS